jgi:hypothetical protein
MEFPGKRLTALAQRYPLAFNPLWAWLYPLIRRGDWHFDSTFQDRATAFKAIHDNNLWISDETRSGLGSTLAYTAPMRRGLEKLLRRLKVKTLLDLPCGDFNWIRHVRLPEGANYLGGDLVVTLIDELQHNHASEHHKFVVLDMVEDEIPPADLWLCRDALFHLPNEDVVSVLKRFSRSAVPFILTTTYDFAQVNRDINPGGFRFINLLAPPFQLPLPAARIADFVVPWPPRYLGLWSREQVLASPLGD